LCLRWETLKKWIRAEAEEAKTLRFLLDVTERNTPLTELALTQALELTRDERLAWCSRYLTGEQIKDVAAWVKESERRAQERRHRARKAVIVLALVALGFAILGLWALRQRAEANRQRAEANRQQADAVYQRTAGRRAAVALRWYLDQMDIFKRNRSGRREGQ
jgi:hypothetical protein